MFWSWVSPPTFVLNPSTIADRILRLLNAMCWVNGNIREGQRGSVRRTAVSGVRCCEVWPEGGGVLKQLLHGAAVFPTGAP